MIPGDFHYGFPEGVYLLFGALVFIALFAAFWFYQEEMLARFTRKTHLIKGQSVIRYMVGAACVSLAWILASLALMQPEGNGHSLNQGEEKKREKREVIFLVDVSASMGVADGRSGRTRLDEAKEIVDQVAARLKGQSASLLSFTSEALELSPLTLDILFVRTVNSQLVINEGTTDIASALNTVKEKFLDQPGLKNVILLSDGGEKRVKPIQAEKPETVRIFTVGIGTKEGGQIPGFKETSELNEEVLRSLAERGKYYPANQLSVLDIAEDIVSSMDEGKVYESGRGVLVYSLYFQIPLALAFLLLMTRQAAAVLVLLVLPLFGGDLEVAKNFAEAGEYERAIERYEEMLQKRLTSYEQSVVRYNLATVLLQSGKHQAAVELFRTIDTNAVLINAWAHTNQMVALVQQDPTVFSKREAIKEFFLASKYACQLQLAIGAKECMLPKELKEMRAQVENTLSEALIAFGNEREHDLSLRLAYVRAALRNIEFLKKTGEQEAEYRALFGLNGDIEQKREELKAEEQEIVDQLQAKGVALTELVGSYESALLQQPVQQLSLHAIKSEQEQLKLDTATLDDALKLLSEGKVDLARLQVEVAQQQIRRLLQKQGDPKQLLESAIENQEHALSLARLARNDPWQPAVQEAQEDVVKRAAPFFDEVLLFQEKQFALQGACQKHPWEKVVPLFAKGLTEARAAVQDHEKITWQELAITSWKKALHEMDQKPEEEQASSNQLVQEVKQMQLDDRFSLPKIVPTTTGEHPW